MAKSRANPLPGLGKKERPKRRGVRRISAGTFISQSRGVSAEQKAMFHNILGVGRRGTLRKFFDLNTSDQTALRDGLEKLLSARLRST